MCCAGPFDVINSEFYAADGRLLKYDTYNGQFINNKISWIDWSGANVVNNTGGIGTVGVYPANASSSPAAGLYRWMEAT